MEELVEKAKMKSLYISLIYVGLGTLSFAMGIKTLTQYDLATAIISIVCIVTMPVCHFRGVSNPPNQ